MIREKVWFDGVKLQHGCVYCYMNWRTEYNKLRSGQDNESNDDIL